MITDWLMVVITIVYVIATIAIFVTNHKNTKAAQESILEMRREFDEANRPLVEVELLYLQKAFLALRFINHGSRTAYNVKIKLSQDFIENLDEKPWRGEVKKQEGKECIIGVGQHYDLFFGDNNYLHRDIRKPATGLIEYESGGKVYTDEFMIDLERYMTIYSVTTDDEKLRKLIHEQNIELKGIKKQIEKMKNSE